MTRSKNKGAKLSTNLTLGKKASSNLLSTSQQEELTQQLVALKASCQRQLIWLKGDSKWAQEICHQLLACLANVRAVPLATDFAVTSSSIKTEETKISGLEITSPAAATNDSINRTTPHRPLTALPPITSNQARHYLGQEHAVLVFNAINGLNPNALGALAGTLVAGGLLILVTPANWPTVASPDYASLSAWPLSYSELSFNFDTRLQQLLIAYQPPVLQENTVNTWQGFIEQLAALVPQAANKKDIGDEKASCQQLIEGALTSCQSQVVEQLLNWFSQKNPQPVVITANRGRGKSGALGLFIRQLLINKLLPSQPATHQQLIPSQQILVTAPSSAATEAIMQRLDSLPAQQLEQVKFIAPDALLAELPPAKLLLIDEAAALPVPLLKAMVKHYPASVFATTQDGYEGNGRGFALRFTGYLTANYPQLLQLELHQPLRWAAHCPLEALINKLLLLQTHLPDPPKLTANQLKQTVSFSWLNQAELAANEELLEKIMALLVLAHYRTNPNNLRQLLDAPNQLLLVAWLNKQPVGLALVQEEGGFPAELAEQIYLGKRRPQGHLLAQSLAFHAGFASAARASYWRAQRILVHPSLQGLGLGSSLLQQLEVAANQQPELDFLGTSFGATTELANFWFKQGYQPVRLGLTANQASGEFTVQLLKPIAGRKPLASKNNAQKLAQNLTQRFAETFINSLGFNFNQLNPALALSLLQASQPFLNASSSNLPHLSQADKQELTAFCQGNRQLVLTHTALKNWLLNNLHSEDRVLLEIAVQFSLQNQPLIHLQQRLGLTGKKQLESYIKQRLAKALSG